MKISEIRTNRIYVGLNGEERRVVFIRFGRVEWAPAGRAKKVGVGRSSCALKTFARWAIEILPSRSISDDCEDCGRRAARSGRGRFFVKHFYGRGAERRMCIPGMRRGAVS